MSKVKLDLNNKPDSAVVSRMATHMAAMDTTEGLANYPTPEPPKMDGITLNSAFVTAMAEAGIAEAEWRLKVALKDDARTSLMTFLNARAGYVDKASLGESTKILSSGFEVRSAGTPIGDMPAPVHLSSSMGDMTGEIYLQWDPIKGAKSYIVQCRTHGLTPGAWTQAKICTSSRISVTDLMPGQEYAFRVQALGAAGTGPWSDETVKMAPA